MLTIKMRRPRRTRMWRPYLSQNPPACGHCDACMRDFAEQAERDRPGHIWAIEGGKIIYLEDIVVEKRLGRRLNPTESVVHRNGNFHDNRDENLEVVTIKALE